MKPPYLHTPKANGSNEPLVFQLEQGKPNQYIAIGDPSIQLNETSFIGHHIDPLEMDDLITVTINFKPPKP